MIYNSYLSYLKNCKNFKERHQVYLTQQDFDVNPVCLLSGVKGNGTLRLVMSNDYYLKENIVLNFNEDNLYFPTRDQSFNYVSFDLQNRGFQQKYLYPIKQKNGSYDLGFFGGITFEADNINLDGNGYTIKMNEQFALNQRFFSILNLGSAPFIPRTGPGNFGSVFNKLKNISIKNIKLGRSSHNGILGNECNHLTIKNVIAFDWEVSGITFNNVDNVLIEKSKFKDANQKVLVNGSYASFYFTLQKLKQLREMKPLDFVVKEVYEKYLKIYYQVNSEFKKFGVVKNKEFKNPSKLLDGLQYGISISQKGPSVNGFKMCGQGSILSNYSENIEIRDVEIENLRVKPLMIKGYWDKEPLVVSVGRLLPRNFRELESVMILMNFYKYMYENNKNYNYGFFPMNLTEERVNYLLSGKDYPLYVNGDVMNHLSKPLIGIRAQCVNNLLLNRVLINNLVNEGKNEKLRGVKHPSTDFKKYQGANTVGVYEINTKMKEKDVSILKLISRYGKTDEKLIFRL